MNLFTIMFLFLIIILLWTLIPMIIREIVNKMNGDRPILVKHEYNKQSGRVFYEWKMTSWHYRIMQRALICNMRYRLATVDQEEYFEDEPPMETLPIDPEHPPAENRVVVSRHHLQDEQQNLREEYWTNASTAEINMRGYKPVERLHDTLLWWRVPQYLMLADAYKFEVPDDITQYPQHTPATMDNKFKSQNYWKFIKGLFSKTGPRDMDTHAIFMVIILIAGAIGGMWMMGFF